MSSLLMTLLYMYIKWLYLSISSCAWLMNFNISLYRVVVLTVSTWKLKPPSFQWQHAYILYIWGIQSPLPCSRGRCASRRSEPGVLSPATTHLILHNMPAFLSRLTDVQLEGWVTALLYNYTRVRFITLHLIYNHARVRIITGVCEDLCLFTSKMHNCKRCRFIKVHCCDR